MGVKTGEGRREEEGMERGRKREELKAEKGREKERGIESELEKGGRVKRIGMVIGMEVIGERDEG